MTVKSSLRSISLKFGSSEIVIVVFNTGEIEEGVIDNTLYYAVVT